MIADNSKVYGDVTGKTGRDGREGHHPETLRRIKPEVAMPNKSGVLLTTA
jgi:hypothetical protein